MGTPPSVETVLISENGNTPWAAALSAGRSPFPRVPRVAVASTVSPHAPSPSPSNPSWVLLSTRPLISQSHRTPAQAGIYEREGFGIINHLALSDATPSVGTPYSMRPAQSRPRFEAENVESLVREIRAACFVLNRTAFETVLDLARTSLGWLCKLLRLDRALQGPHAVPKQKVGEVIEIKDEENETVVYGDPNRSSGDDVKRGFSVYPFRRGVCSPVCSNPVTLCRRLAAQ